MRNGFENILKFQFQVWLKSCQFLLRCQDLNGCRDADAMSNGLIVSKAPSSSNLLHCKANFHSSSANINLQHSVIYFLLFLGESLTGFAGRILEESLRRSTPQVWSIAVWAWWSTTMWLCERNRRPRRISEQRPGEISARTGQEDHVLLTVKSCRETKISNMHVESVPLRASVKATADDLVEI